MLVSLIYEVCLFVFSLVAFPKLLYQMIFKHKYRQSFLNRFGGNFPIIKKGERPLIWIHAVSLGETKAAAALAKILKAEFRNPILIFSTVTETGYVEACRTIPADYHVYLPYDFGWIIKPIIKRTKPDLVILCESEFWYNFLRSSKKAGAVVALVNGKISERSLERFSKIPIFSKALFSCIDLYCVQSHLYRQRFESLGVPPEKIAITGNMKFDGDYSRLPATQLEAWRHELGINQSDPVLVVGSSHHPEEMQLLKVFSSIWPKIPRLKVILVPRHPERFNEVAGILQKSNIKFRRLSQKGRGGNKDVPVILIDAMGLLRKCYQLADVALVAGSYLQRVGGHNILEPSWYGVPVLFGPCMSSQPDLVELVKEYNAGLQVTMEELPQTILELFNDSSHRKNLGENGLRLAGDVHGATKKTSTLLKAQLATYNRPLV